MDSYWLMPTKTCSFCMITRWQRQVNHQLDRSCVATRLIISTWWGCTSWKKQNTRWIFKRAIRNKLSSNKFSTSGHPRLLWKKKTSPDAAAASIFIMDSIIDGFKIMCYECCSLEQHHTSSSKEMSLPVCCDLLHGVCIFNYVLGFSADYNKRFWTCLHQSA